MKRFSFDDLDQILQDLPSELKQKKLSILLPFYNERHCIVSNIRIIADTLTRWGWNFEIIASDDGSQDNGSELIMQECADIKQLKCIKTTRNYGKGRALTTAYEVSEGEYILFLDSDLELPVEHIPYFFKEMHAKNADIVIGSKEDSRSNLVYPFLRKLFSRVYAFGIKILFNLPLKDTQTGIKLFKRQALENSLPYLLVKKFAFDIELLVLCNYQHNKIISHPIILQFTRESYIGRMNLDTILHMIKDTLAVFWRLKTNFWKQIHAAKISLKHLVITFEPHAKAYTGEILYLQNIQELSLYLDKIKNYDTVIFLRKGDELPEFASFALERAFSNPDIQGIYPLIYSQNIYDKSFLYYSLLTNMFFNVGYYGHYRPIRQNFIHTNKNVTNRNVKISFKDMIFRSEYLIHLLQDKELDFTVKEFSQIIHSPYVFIHRTIPYTKDLWEQYIQEEEYLNFGIKRQCQNFYLMMSLLGIIGILLGYFLWIIPWLVLEIAIHCWYILSLGIRMGSRYLILFDKIRLSSMLTKLKKIIAILKK